MSDVKTIKIELPDALEEPAKALSMPLATNIGTTIADLWFLALGGISQKAALKRVKYAHSLEEYKADLEKKLNKIPEERRIEPNTQVVMNALNDSQSCVEEETLREMFANLIAAACDNAKANSVHPAFPGIIKQMSTIDAEILFILGQKASHPIVNVLGKVEKGSIPIAKNVVFEDTGRYDMTTQRSSIECLTMLGLVEFDYLSPYVDETRYEPFKRLPIYMQVEASKLYEYAPNKYMEVKGAELEKGRIALTAFGRRFLTACT